MTVLKALNSDKEGQYARTCVCWTYTCIQLGTYMWVVKSCGHTCKCQQRAQWSSVALGHPSRHSSPVTKDSSPTPTSAKGIGHTHRHYLLPTQSAHLKTWAYLKILILSTVRDFHLSSRNYCNLKNKSWIFNEKWKLFMLN